MIDIVDRNMPRIAQRLALIGAITASIFGYLLYTPNIGDMEQLNRVRALGATMKIAHLIVCLLFVYNEFLTLFSFTIGFSRRNIWCRYSCRSYTRSWQCFKAFKRYKRKCRCSSEK